MLSLMKIKKNLVWLILSCVIFSVTELTLYARTEVAPAPGAAQGLYDISVNTIDGQKTTLKPYVNQVMLIVNTASRCGYTPQYTALEKMYEKYKAQGLVVLGFPSNDFLGQEPGTNAQIKLFCQGNYHVDFPLFEKGPVGGDGIQPLYRYLLSHSDDHSAVGWNFEKFLIARDGKILKRFRSSTKPDSEEVVKSVEEALLMPVTPAQTSSKSK